MKINGWIFFAAIMLVVTGTMTAINGLRAIIDDEHYLYGTTAGGSPYAVGFDLTVWGWIHLLLGIIVVMAAFALLRGALWARFVAAVLAGMSAVAQIGFIDSQPFWALAVIAIDVIVIYAVCTMGRADEEVEIPMQM
jgi:hypothetical protein